MPFNSKRTNVNKFTVYFSPTCSFARFSCDFWIAAMVAAQPARIPSGLSVEDLWAAQNRPLSLFYPAWNSSRRFHIWEGHETQSEIVPPGIEASHLYYCSTFISIITIKSQLLQQWDIFVASGWDFICSIPRLCALIKINRINRIIDRNGVMCYI